MNAPAKPAFLSPCNGCGLCCTREVCKLGVDFFQTTVAPCPGLRSNGERYLCTLVEMADSMGTEQSHALRVVLGIGIGCDAQTDEELEAEDRAVGVQGR